MFCGANGMRITTDISGCYSKRFPQHSRGRGGVGLGVRVGVMVGLRVGWGWGLFSS